MSLINDALRRNKEEKDKATPQGSDGSPMQPVHPHEANSAFPLRIILVVLIVLMLLVAALLFWKAMESKKQLAGVAESQVPPQPVPVETKVIVPAHVPTPTQAVDATPVASTPTPTNLSPTNVVAPTNPPVAAVLPVPVPLKLQGIFYRPANPTVMINGKTLGVGEKVAGARVLKIERESVTVERDGKQETLELE